jgi:hypothetical protein
VHDIGFGREVPGLQVFDLRTVDKSEHLRVDEDIDVPVEIDKNEKQQKSTRKEYDGEELLNEREVAEPDPDPFHPNLYPKP